MNTNEFHRLLMRSLLAALLLSLIGMLYGQYLIQPIIPLLGMILDQFTSTYVPILSVVEQDGAYILHLSATVVKTIQLTASHTIAPGAHMTAGIHLYHALVPIVILFTALFAWPTKILKERLVLLGLGIPACLLLLSATLPILLGSHIESLLLDQAASYGAPPRNTPLIMDLAIMIESGGMWALALMIAVFCRKKAHAFTAIDATPNRGLPFPG